MRNNPALLTVALLVALAPLRAEASGEANAAYLSKLYRLELGSGVRKILADPNDTYYEDHARSYRASLSPLVKPISALIEGARESMHIQPFDPGSSRNVTAEVRVRPGSSERIKLTLTCSAKPPKAALDALTAEVAKLIAPRVDREGKDAPAFVELEPAIIERPGLFVQVRSTTRHVEKAHAERFRARFAAKAKRAEELIVPALVAESSALGLPEGWPQVRAEQPDLGAPLFTLRYYEDGIELSVRAPVPAPVDEALGTRLRKQVAEALFPSR